MRGLPANDIHHSATFLSNSFSTGCCLASTFKITTSLIVAFQGITLVYAPPPIERAHRLLEPRSLGASFASVSDVDKPRPLRRGALQSETPVVH
jgi:hypothetical protein